MQPIPQILSRIRERGGKATPQRMAIYRVLEGNTSHPTAEDVFTAVRPAMPMVSRTTVYKTLNELVSMGEIKHFDVDGVTHFDPDTRPHAEIACLSCGAIVDAGPAVPEAEDVPDGFRVSYGTLTYYGYCAKCHPHAAGATSERRDG